MCLGSICCQDSELDAGDDRVKVEGHLVLLLLNLVDFNHFEDFRSIYPSWTIPEKSEAGGRPLRRVHSPEHAYHHYLWLIPIMKEQLLHSDAYSSSDYDISLVLPSQRAPHPVHLQTQGCMLGCLDGSQLDLVKFICHMSLPPVFHYFTWESWYQNLPISELFNASVTLY